jgi:tetratricopeptide (TPR) repeat protein
MRSRRSRAVAALAVLAAIVLAAGPVRAQQDRDDDQKARELFRLGEGHYAAGRYEKAAVLYDEAYRLSGRAELLLAMVNTYERMGDYPQAIERLREYLDHPRAKNVASLRDRLERLERAQRDRDEERRRVQDLEKSDKERARELRRLRQQRQGGGGEEQERRDGRPSRMAAYLFLGGGAVGVLGAVGFGLAANGAGQDAEQQCGEGGLCRGAAGDALDRELTFSILADVSAVAGIGSAAFGAYLLWKRRGATAETRSALRIGPAVLPGGVGVSLAGDL